MLRWIPFGERPFFSSFRDEIVNNLESTIDEEQFEEYLVECIGKMEGTTFTLREMMALKLFTDTTVYQSFLRKAHWVNTPLSTKKMYHFWASALYEAALYHSVPIPSVNGKAPVSLYHGLNRMFTVRVELPKYHGPFSSTMERTVAQHFTNDQGLYFQIQPSFSNKLKCCLGINMETISCFKNEREILLVDQFIPIQRTETMQDGAGVLVDHFMFSLKGRSTEIRDRGRFLKQLGIRFDPKWMPLIGGHSQLFAASAFEGRLVIGRLVMELDIFNEVLVRSIIDEQFGGKPVIINLVEQCKVQQLLPLYRVMTSKFKVLQNHALNRCFKIELVRNSKMDHIVAGDTVNDSCFEETEYEINGVAVPHSVSTVKGVVHRIQCRNTKLFGDRVVWSQQFDASTDVLPEGERVDLVVEKHRGHYGSFHPNKLLDGKKGTFYLSKRGSPSSDWIIFKQREQQRFVSTKIMIRNGPYEYAIKSIAIQCSEDGVEYQELIQIDDIKQGKEEKQWFDLNPQQSRFMKFIKLNILGNYGFDYNGFYEFGVFGHLE